MPRDENQFVLSFLPSSHTHYYQRGFLNELVENIYRIKGRHRALEIYFKHVPNLPFERILIPPKVCDVMHCWVHLLARQAGRYRNRPSLHSPPPRAPPPSYSLPAQCYTEGPCLVAETKWRKLCIRMFSQGG